MAATIKIAKKLDEVVSPYCNCKGGYCILKEILLSKHTDPRFIVQLKCIEHFKWEESQTLNRDIGWNEAHEKWIDRGFATAFAKFYNEDDTAEQIYQNILVYLNQK